ncbi:putative fatty acyl-CoA reductase CG5065 isoform X2 [Ornithodoros turicata]
MLIRPRKGSKSKERLDELLKAECFKHIHQEHPSALNKLIAIDGDLTEPGLGLRKQDYDLLTKEVSVVFHSAATIKFNETLRHAVEMNIEGTRKVLELCHQMPNLQAVVHVSTAYCNCDSKTLDETIYPPPVHPEHVISCTKWMEDSMLAAITPHLLNAKPNTYVLAKFLSETLVAEEGSDLPVAIVRPSIVAAAWKEPFPGWVDALNGSTSLLASCASGVMTTIVTDVNGIADIVPVDVVANLLIVVACQTAKKRNDTPRPAVYNCVTGSLNKCVVGDVKQYLKKFLPKYPLQDTFGYPWVDMTSSRAYQAFMVFFRNYLPALAVDFYRKCTGKRPRMVRFLEQSKGAMEAVRFFTTQTWEFSSNNMLLLHSKLSSLDRQTFDIDIRKIDWESYWENYLLGVRQYLFKQDPSTLAESRKRLKRNYLLQTALKLVLLLGFLRFLVTRSKAAHQVWCAVASFLTRMLQFLLRFP